MRCMFYADDVQIYTSFSPAERAEATARITTCMSDVKSWSTTNKLKLNDSKSEFIHFVSCFSKRKQMTSVHIGDSVMNISAEVRNLGVRFDSSLLMKSQVKSVCSSALFGIRQIGCIRRFLDDRSATTLVHAFVTSRLDYCNSLLYNLPKTHIMKLQHVQNTAARLVSRTKPYCHISPVLHKLHWLPIKQRIAFKIMLLTYKSVHNASPSYISELITAHVPTRNLRSSSRFNFEVPKVRMRYGARSFAAAAPKLWNGLPQDIKSADSIESFKTLLKTFLFNNAEYA